MYRITITTSRAGENQGHDEPVQRQRLAEDQDQDHAHEDLVLLRVGPHARVAHDADGQSGRQRAEAAAEPRSQVRVAVVERVPGSVD